MKTYMLKDKLAAGMMAAALLTSCQSEEFGFTKQEVRRTKYDREFIQTFGQPAEGHQWGYGVFGDETTRGTVAGAPSLMEDGELQSGRIMCEDMGGKDSDFDFNDIVYDVAFNGKLCYVTMQAAGGTLAMELYYGDTQLKKDNDGEIHAMFDAEVTKPVNVGSAKGTTGTAITWVLGFGADDRQVEIEGKTYNVIPMNGSFDIKNFAIKVNATKSEWINVSNQTSTTPLCICVPLDVCWAKENKRIDKAYTGFAAWVQDESKEFWKGTKDDGLLCGAATSPVPETDNYSDPEDWNLAPRR